MYANATQMTFDNNGAKPITWNTSNLERMRLTSAGYLGIGTSSPSTPLHIQGTSTLGSVYQLRLSDNTGANLYIGGGTGGAQLQSTGGIPLYLNYGGNNVLIGTGGSGGNVGIGTSSPSYALDVNNTSSSQLRLQNTTATSYASMLFAASGQTFSIGVGGASETGIQVPNQLYIYDSTAGVVRLRLDTSGNLGLGVTANTTNVGGTYKLLSVGTSGGSGIFMGQSDSTASGSAVAQFFGKTTGTAGYQLAGGMIVALDGTSTTNAVGRLQFYTASGGSVSEAMRIDSSGNLLVGCTATGPSTSTGARMYSTGYISSTLSGSTNATDTLDVYSTGASAYRFYVDMAGTVHATSIVITAISDQRLKENIRDLDTGLSTVMALKPRRFDWKEGKGQDKKNAVGFIAQEFQEILPNSISTFKAGEDGIDYLTMNHEELIPTLVKAIQEQQAIIEQLKAKVGL